MPRIRNNTSRKYSYVQVTFNVYNKADEQVGTAMANVNGLEPGSIWRFPQLICAIQHSPDRDLATKFHVFGESLAGKLLAV